MNFTPVSGRTRFDAREMLVILRQNGTVGSKHLPHSFKALGWRYVRNWVHVNVFMNNNERLAIAKSKLKEIAQHINSFKPTEERRIPPSSDKRGCQGYWLTNEYLYDLLKLGTEAAELAESLQNIG